jgi:hypothetical protein
VPLTDRESIVLRYLASGSFEPKNIQSGRYLGWPTHIRVEALPVAPFAFSIPLFVFLFATMYFLIEGTTSNAFLSRMTRLEASFHRRRR